MSFDELHPLAPTGSQLTHIMGFMQSHFVPFGSVFDTIPVQSDGGFVAKRPREQNMNQDSSRQALPGVNVMADLGALKRNFMPDVDSILRRRVHHNGAYYIGAQLATTTGVGTLTTNGTTAVVGVGTSFDQTLVGRYLTIVGEPKPRRVRTVTDGTHLTLTKAATTTASGLAWKHADTPVFPYLMHPRTPNEIKHANYLDSMWCVRSDGAGGPVTLYEMAMSDLEFKVSGGKISDVSETWVGTVDTYAGEAVVTKAVSAYASLPYLAGHFEDNLVQPNLPLNIKITDAAGSGFDGKFKAALTRTLTGTLATDGTVDVVGTGTAFDDELAPGDEVYITGETVRVVDTITDATHLALTVAATTTASGLSAKAATFAGTAVAFTFGRWVQVTNPSFPFGMGRSAFDTVSIIFPDGHGTVSVGDEWSFTEPRTLVTTTTSRRDPLHAAGLQVIIDDTLSFGSAVPGDRGFDSATVKLVNNKTPYRGTGGVYAQAADPTGKVSASVSFDRKRVDEYFLNALIAARSVKVVITILGNPFGATGIPELWRFTFSHCEIADVNRDVSTPDVLPEKIDINATRGFIRELSGVVTTNGTTALVGVGTAFLSEVARGDEIHIDGETVRTVVEITDDTHLTLSSAATTSGSGKDATAISPVWVEELFSTLSDITEEAA